MLQFLTKLDIGTPYCICWATKVSQTQPPSKFHLGKYKPESEDPSLIPKTELLRLVGFGQFRTLKSHAMFSFVKATKFKQTYTYTRVQCRVCTINIYCTYVSRLPKLNWFPKTETQIQPNQFQVGFEILAQACAKFQLWLVHSDWGWPGPSGTTSWPRSYNRVFRKKTVRAVNWVRKNAHFSPQSYEFRKSLAWPT